MKRFVLSLALVAIGYFAFAPAAFSSTGRQLSTSEQLSEDATLHDLVQHNRDVRGKK